MDEVLDSCTFFICPRPIRQTRETQIWVSICMISWPCEVLESRLVSTKLLISYTLNSLLAQMTLRHIKEEHKSRTSSTNSILSGPSDKVKFVTNYWVVWDLVDKVLILVLLMPIRANEGSKVHLLVLWNMKLERLQDSYPGIWWVIFGQKKVMIKKNDDHQKNYSSNSCIWVL